VLLEGKVNDKGVHRSLINAITIGWGIPIFFTNNVHESAHVLQSILEKHVLKQGASTIPPSVISKQYTPERIRWSMLQAVKGVGSVTATNILNDIPDILFSHWGKETLDLKLSRVKGLGKESRELIVKAICYE
jgi:ERCC4-type nuclease